MERRKLQSGRLTGAAYDARSQELEIEFADGSTRQFSAVPAEVWRRLIASPSAASFYADRIEEEYPVKSGRTTGSPDARSKLDDLFGGPDKA